MSLGVYLYHRITFSSVFLRIFDSSLCIVISVTYFVAVDVRQSCYRVSRVLPFRFDLLHHNLFIVDCGGTFFLLNFCLEWLRLQNLFSISANERNSMNKLVFYISPAFLSQNEIEENVVRSENYFCRTIRFDFTFKHMKQFKIFNLQKF